MLERTIDGLRPYWKAVAPAALGVLALIIIGITDGAIDPPALEVAVIGFLAASLAFAVDNAPDGWQRYAKAVVPAALTIFGVLVHFIVTGEWNAEEWRIALSGLGAALVTFLTPNGSLYGDGGLIPAPVKLHPSVIVNDLDADPLTEGGGLVSDADEFANQPPTEPSDTLPPAPANYSSSGTIMPSQDDQAGKLP